MLWTKLKRLFDLKTLIFSLSLSCVWIFFSDFLVHQGFYDYFDIQAVQTAKGLVYVTCLSLLLSYFHQREKNVLKTQQEDYSRLFSDSPQILAIYRLSDYRILDANQRAVEYYGYERDELLGMSVLDLRPKEERKKLLAVLNSDNIESSENMTWIHQKKSGEEFPVKVYGREIVFQSTSCRLVTVSDVTDIRAAQELSAINSKLITLGEVSANIGHEIQNPLSIMELTLNKLEDQLEHDRYLVKYSKELDLLNSSIHRVSDTISSLQRLSRGDAESERDEVLASLLIKESTILMRQQLEMHSVHLEFGHLPEVKIYCHAGQITQVILNILKNALDSLLVSDLGPRKIRIDASVDKQQERIQIAIQNNGPLLSEDTIEDLFTPFFTTKGKARGTGLGLPLSRKIVERHGGELQCKVIRGKTHFIIDLPLGEKA